MMLTEKQIRTRVRKVITRAEKDLYSLMKSADHAGEWANTVHVAFITVARLNNDTNLRFKTGNVNISG